MDKQKYITLKEAAKISGYAPDYVGQLIRSGKIPGKQVYCTVAWTTTEEALREYIKRNEGQKRNGRLQEKLIERMRQIKTRILLEMKLATLFKTALYFTVILSVGFSLLLFYIFSVSVEKKLQQRTIEKYEIRQ